MSAPGRLYPPLDSMNMLSESDPARRIVAIRSGWNDAAWGRSHKDAIDATLAGWYEQGFLGGAAFRSFGPNQPSTETAKQAPR